MQQIAIALIWIVLFQLLGKVVTKLYVKMVEIKKNKNKNDR